MPTAGSLLRWPTFVALMLLALLWLVWFRLQEVERYKAANEIKFSVNDWQPPYLPANTTDHPAISRQQWTFDFSRGEPILGQFATNDIGELIVNEKTRELVERLILAVGAHNSEDTLTRTNTLITKTLAPQLSTPLTKLTKQYTLYLKARVTIVDNKKSSVASALITQNQLQALQTELFGKKDAQRLFGKQNKIKNYLLARLKIISDKELSQQEKSRQLNQLARDFSNGNLESANSVARDINE